MLGAYIAVISKCIIYGASVIFTGALTSSIDFLDVLSLRFLISLLSLWVLKELKIFKIGVGIKDIVCRKPSVRIKNLLLTAFFEPVLYMLFEASGISMATGVTTAVILSLPPILCCISESIILKERTTFLQKTFLCTGIFGVVYIALNTESSNGKDTPLGIFLLIGAVISTVLFQTLARKYSDNSNPFEISYVSCILGTFVFNAINVIRHLIKGDITHYFDPLFDKENIIGFIFLGVICTVIALSLSLYALSKIQVSTFSAFSGLTTLVTIVLGVLVFREKLYFFHYIGFVCIIIQMVGVSAISIIKDKKKNLK